MLTNQRACDQTDRTTDQRLGCGMPHRAADDRARSRA